MNKLTLDADKVTVDSFQTEVAGDACPGASAGATARTCPLDLSTSGALD
ncbi:hypothetical protein [Longimicrobium sp.]